MSHQSSDSVSYSKQVNEMVNKGKKNALTVWFHADLGILPVSVYETINTSFKCLGSQRARALANPGPLAGPGNDAVAVLSIKS